MAATAEIEEPAGHRFRRVPYSFSPSCLSHYCLSRDDVARKRDRRLARRGKKTSWFPFFFFFTCRALTSIRENMCHNAVSASPCSFFFPPRRVFVDGVTVRRRPDFSVVRDHFHCRETAGAMARTAGSVNGAPPVFFFPPPFSLFLCLRGKGRCRGLALFVPRSTGLARTTPVCSPLFPLLELLRVEREPGWAVSQQEGGRGGSFLPILPFFSPFLPPPRFHCHLRLSGRDGSVETYRSGQASHQDRRPLGSSFFLLSCGRARQCKAITATPPLGFFFFPPFFPPDRGLLKRRARTRPKYAAPAQRITEKETRSL